MSARSTSVLVLFCVAASWLAAPSAHAQHEIVDWAEKFNFTIDKDVVIFGHGNTTAFIDELDKQFNDWHTNEKYKNGKV